MFAVRHKENARQTIYLPCAKIKTHGKLFFTGRFFLPCAVENAHGKASLCRAPENMCMAKIETHRNHRFSCSDARFWDWEALGNSRWSMPRCIIVEKQEGVCLEDLRASLLRGTQNVPAQSLDENDLRAGMLMGGRLFTSIGVPGASHLAARCGAG
jgi:hypothetical protein